MVTSRIGGLSLLTMMVFILFCVGVPFVSAQEGRYVYDYFNDGVINTALWDLTGDGLGLVYEHLDGGLILSNYPGTNAEITATDKHLTGMWFHAQCISNFLSSGGHINVSIGTTLPNDGNSISAGILFDDNRTVNKSVLFAQWINQYGLVEWVDIAPAQWGIPYTFGLEYTSDGSILVWVNDQVVHSFLVPGADILYSQGGASFWFHAMSVFGGENSALAIVVSAEAKRLPCDFSTTSTFERCFGGIGVQCEGIPLVAEVSKDEDTCMALGWMSVGSIMHDRCCYETNNAGYSCSGLNQGNKKLCYKEWQEAWYNTQCTALGAPRQWLYHFGPYAAGNTGDDITQDFRAPSGTRVNPKYEKYCETGRCRVNEKGKMIKYIDACGHYCECE